MGLTPSPIQQDYFFFLAFFFFATRSVTSFLRVPLAGRGCTPAPPCGPRYFFFFFAAFFFATQVHLLSVGSRVSARSEP